MLFKFFDQWRSITSNRFVLNKVQGHHLQLRYHLPLFFNFLHFSVKMAVAHHPIIQKELDELLVKGMIEPSSGVAGFYSSMFVVPKHISGLWPMHNLKHFNHYLHIPSFKLPTIRHVWQLVQHNDVCSADRGSLPQPVRWWQGQLEYLCQRSTNNIGRNGKVGVLNKVYQTMPSLLLN